jgi:hypothetical protein
MTIEQMTLEQMTTKSLLMLIKLMQIETFLNLMTIIELNKTY